MSSAVDSERVWRHISAGSFAVLSHVTSGFEPRSSGVSYATVGRRLYVAVAPDSWKARQVADGQLVSLVVPVRRGGLLSALLPIPPATIAFRARARVRPMGSIDITVLPAPLVRALRALGYASNSILELAPEGRFLTYGIGVSILAMRDSALAQASIPIEGR